MICIMQNEIDKIGKILVSSIKNVSLVKQNYVGAVDMNLRFSTM